MIKFLFIAFMILYYGIILFMLDRLSVRELMLMAGVGTIIGLLGGYEQFWSNKRRPYR